MQRKKVTERLLSSVIVLVDDIKTSYPNSKIAIISIVENLATTGKFTQKVRHLDTKKIAQIHNQNISNLCAKKGFTYIE